MNDSVLESIDWQKELEKSKEKSQMERACELTDQQASEELSRNEERARFICLNINDFGDHVPGGRVIDTSTIRKVLVAKEGQSGLTTHHVIRMIEAMTNGGVVTKRDISPMAVFINRETSREYNQIARSSTKEQSGMSQFI